MKKEEYGRRQISFKITSALGNEMHQVAYAFSGNLKKLLSDLVAKLLYDYVKANNLDPYNLTENDLKSIKDFINTETDYEYDTTIIPELQNLFVKVCNRNRLNPESEMISIIKNMCNGNVPNESEPVTNFVTTMIVEPKQEEVLEDNLENELAALESFY